MSPLVMDKSPAAHREAFHFTKGNAALYQSRWPPQWEKIMTPSFVLPSFALNFYNLTFDKLGLEVYLKHTKKEHPEKEPPFHKPNVLPEMIPNVAVSMNVPSYLCMCVCVCLHGREAGLIASGCTPRYVSDPGLMKLKAWHLWGASAETQSDGHLILLLFPGGVHTHLRTRHAVCTSTRRLHSTLLCTRSCHICCPCNLGSMLDFCCRFQ